MHAWRLRDPLELNAFERMRTKRSLADEAAMILLGVVSISIAQRAPKRWMPAAGLIYTLIPAYYTLAGMYWRRRERSL